ncbi:MAG: T9SS type A sorting domain-containing protein [Bacteroidetes bacterium]|nr:T9SS type A sorting domain-containing protein [Bacteroidota bacterium]
MKYLFSLNDFRHFHRVWVWILICLPLAVMSQESDRGPVKLTHWMTPEELLLRHTLGKGFVETDPPVGPVRNVAEFDEMQGVLIRYPFGIPMTLVKEMAENVMVTTIVANTSQQTTVTNQYISNGVNINHCNFLIAPSDSYWTRDYGPWFASDANMDIGIVDFPYNRPNRPNDDEIPVKVAQMLGVDLYGMNVIHTGGNYMSDGYGQAASTELVWEENPSQTTNQIATKMHDYLGIDLYHVRPDPNNTYIDHIDCWSKFLGVGKILVRSVPSSHPQYNEIEAAAAYWTTQTSPFGLPYQVFRVYTPNNQPYTNSLILNNKVLVPIMNSQWDDDALDVYEQAMPGYEIIGIINNTGAPWESTDALHCRAIGIADLGMLRIRHIPITGNQPAEVDYVVNADIINFSDTAVYADSVLIIYQVNNGMYDTIPMTHVSGYQFTGTIPHQAGGSQVSYYLFAADRTGRRSFAPRMASLDPYVFNTVWTDLTVVPDTLYFLTVEDCLNGKIASIHNFTAGPLDLDDVEQDGQSAFYWFVNPWPFPSFPYTVNSGDSVNLHVYIGVPVDHSSLTDFVYDTLDIITELGHHHLILAVNEEVIQSVRAQMLSNDLLQVQVYPNPFTDKIQIGYQLASSTRLDIRITSTSGHIVKQLFIGSGSAGSHNITWDGFDNAGRQVQAGIYLYQIKTDRQVVTGKIIRL